MTCVTSVTPYRPTDHDELRACTGVHWLAAEAQKGAAGKLLWLQVFGGGDLQWGLEGAPQLGGKHGGDKGSAHVVAHYTYMAGLRPWFMGLS